MPSQPVPRPDAAQILSEYAARLQYYDIPPAVRDATKTCILDMLAVIVAGTSHAKEEGYDRLLDLIVEGGGKPESTILGYGHRVPAWMAAWANSALSRVLHYDDTYDEAVTHASCTCIPAALAVAERIGGVSGKDFITAVTAGNDITSRMGLSICLRPNGWKADWYQTTLHGIFGAAAACGKLLRLDTNHMQNALGIALYEAAGTLEGPGIASNFTAKGAVLSALMAAGGIKGCKTALEGPAGFYPTYYHSDYNRDALVGELGRRFESAGISLKPWPGLRNYHPYIDATLQLVRGHHIVPQDMERITIHVAGYVEDNIKDLEMRRRPTTLLEAITSLPYLVAAAAARGQLLVRHICADDLKDPAALQLAQKVVPVHDPRFNIDSRIGPSMVDIQTRDGHTYTAQTEVAYGHPRNPMTGDDFLAKYRDCVSQSVTPLSGADAQRLADTVYHLEDIPDMSEVVRLLA